MSVSVIVPTYNEEDNIVELVSRIDKALVDYQYEIIFVDDHSVDATKEKILKLAKKYPILFYEKKGKKGKAYSLIEGFSYVRYDTLAILDADLQYSPEALPEMLKKIEMGADVVVANRIERKTSFIRQVFSKSFQYLFVKLLHNIDVDSQAGEKCFRKEIIDRISISPTAWTFDLNFILEARDAGYTIESHDVIFSERKHGKSNVNVLKASFEIGLSAIKLKFASPKVIPFDTETVKKKGQGFHYKQKEYIHYSDLPIDETAFYRVSATQKLVLFVLVAVLVLGLIINWHTVVVFLLAILISLYFLDCFFMLYSIVRSYTNPVEIKISAKELKIAKDREWPTYTVLCPLYKDWKIIPQFINAMSRLEYPKEKLQILLLLEEDDKESIEHVSDFTLPDYFQVLVVPDCVLKTKPRACNYGLTFAKGKYTVIFDAEDKPDVLQLKKAVLAFDRSPENVVCVQAKLNFYNSNQNLLTRMFSTEYSLWFDLILPGLQSIHAPLPLGGTSNFFITETLRRLGCWDSLNVTEDCDVGLRLFKKGYQTVILDSTTLEESTSAVGNWLGQRSRWMKGFVVSYFVHMRHPADFFKTKHWYHFFTFQIIIMGKVTFMSINLLMWIITISYFLFRPQLGLFIQSFFPAPVLYLGVFCLVVGNFAYIYYYLMACFKHEQYELVKYALLIPLYWVLLSLASWRGFYGFLVKPHVWFKTRHGDSFSENEITEQIQAVRDLGNIGITPAVVEIE